MVLNGGSCSRREVLRNWLAVAAAGAASPAFAQTNDGKEQEKKINQRKNQEEIKGEEKSRGRKWLITCRDAHLHEIGQPNSWSAMEAINADGIELSLEFDDQFNLGCPYLFDGEEKFALGSPDKLKALMQRFRKHKKRIAAFCLHNQYDVRREEEIKFTIKAAELAAELQVPAIRLDVVPRKTKEDEFLKIAIDIGKRLVKETAPSKVRFGVENHGGTTNKVEFLDKLFDGVGSDRFGLTLDTGNFYWYGNPLPSLYEIYAKFAARACHTHCKSIKYPESERDKKRQMGWEYGKYCSPIYEGDIDFRKVVQILRQAKYRGDLCIENESLGRFTTEQRLEILKKEIAYLREVTAAI